MVICVKTNDVVKGPSVSVSDDVAIPGVTTAMKMPQAEATSSRGTPIFPNVLITYAANILSLKYSCAFVSLKSETASAIGMANHASAVNMDSNQSHQACGRLQTVRHML